MKKVLSLVLVIAMVLSSMSFAFAAKFEDVTGDYEKAIDTLAALGIITGYEDGTYRPEKVVTRAEMAKLMVEILGYGNLVSGAKSNFTDTQGHWADQWIAIAAGRNIVIGTGDGKFLPDRTVSYDEVLTMIVRGLGYTDNSNEIKSMTWPTNFKVKAAEVGVTDGVKMSATGADRGGVAKALYNALNATLVSVNNDGDITNLKDANNDLMPLLSRIAKKVGTEATPYTVTANKVDPKHRDYAGDNVDLAAYMYQDLQVYVSKLNDKEVVYIAKSYSNVVEGTLKANDPSGSTYATNGKVNVKLADGSTKTLLIGASSLNVFYNGKETSMNETEIENTFANGVNLKNAAVTVLVNDNDQIQKIVAEKATFGDKVTREYKKDAVQVGRVKLPKNGDNVDLSKVTVTGVVDDINDIKVDDVVIAYAGQGTNNSSAPSNVKLVVVRETVEGKITDINADGDVVKIDGKSYDVSAVPGVETFDAGQEGTFFLDNKGKVFASEASTASNAKDYAVVIQTLPGEKRTSDDRITLKPEIKLINAKGEVVTYEVSTKATYQGTTRKVLDDTTTTGSYTNLIFNTDAVGGDRPTSKSLVKYKLDSDNKISKLEIVEVDAIASGLVGRKTSVDTQDSKFDLAEDAPVFYINPILDAANTPTVTQLTDKANYAVVTNLPGTINLTYSELNDGGAYKVIVSTNAGRGGAGVYALITGVGKATNSDGDKVTRITAYVDGKEVVYLADSDSVTVTSSAIDTGAISNLTLNNGKVTANVTGVVGHPSISGEISSATETRMQVKDSAGTKTWYELDSNVVVYIINSKGEFVEVGSVDDLRGSDLVAMYNVFDTTASEYDIIVIK